MKDKLISTDQDFVEAYRNVTKLLQSFLNRQQSIKKDSNVIFDERSENAEIIHYIQWVRYHFWGNSDNVIKQKTNIGEKDFGKNIFGFITYKLNDFACDQLNATTTRVTSAELIELILNKILPQQSNSIFSTNLIERSITLQYEIDRIRKKIHPDD